MKQGGRILGHQGRIYITNTAGTMSAAVSRSLGGIACKAFVRNSPQTQCVDLGWGERHPFLLLIGMPIADRIGAQELIDMAAEFTFWQLSSQPTAMARVGSARYVQSLSCRGTRPTVRTR